MASGDVAERVHYVYGAAAIGAFLSGLGLALGFCTGTWEEENKTLSYDKYANI